MDSSTDSKGGMKEGELTLRVKAREEGNTDYV